MLTTAQFNDNDLQTSKENGVFKCKRSNCYICKDYLVEGKFVLLENNKVWEVRSHITCNSKNVLYFQRCIFCDGNCSNIGKTNNFRFRTNVHISSCRLGDKTDDFDRHVYNCNKDPHKKKKGPFFKLWALMEVDDFSKLITYENYLHRCGYDTINRGKPE